eukprot:COSAG02_NODE_1578_length_11853_cov_3.734048_3_plen_521_part_00
MLALKACIAPKTRRRGRTSGKGAANAAAAAAADGAARGKARAPPAASSPAASAQGPEATSCTPRDGRAAVTAHLPQSIERPTAVRAEYASGVVRRDRSGSWETDAQTSPKFSRGCREEEPSESQSDTRRQRRDAEANDRTLSGAAGAVETTSLYTPVSRLEWSSSLSSDSPRVLSGCGNTASLPAGWFQAERDGVSYYYNRRTGKRLWHHPSGCKCPTETPLPPKTLSTASSAQQSPAAWTRSGSSDGGNTPHPNTYYYRRGWHGAAPTLSLSTNSSGNRTTSAGTGISGRTTSYASKTVSVASAAAPYPPPPTPVGRGLLAESVAKHPGRTGGPRRSIVKMLAQLDRELLEGASPRRSQPPHPEDQTAARAAQQTHDNQTQEPKMVHPALKQCSNPAPTVSPAAETERGVEEGVPPPGAVMAPRGRLRHPRSRRGSFAESVLSQPASIPDDPTSGRTISDHEASTGAVVHEGLGGNLGRGWGLHHKKRLSTKYETDFEGSGVEIEQVSRFEAVSNQHDI